MYKVVCLILCSGMLLIGCAEKTEKTGDHTQHDHAAKATPKEDPFKDVTFAAKKDLVCGMPISAGIIDTAHYKGNIYGFCAPECKADFVKDPETYLAAQ